MREACAFVGHVKLQFFGLGNLFLCIHYVVSINSPYLVLFCMCDILLFGTLEAPSTLRHIGD